MKYIVGNVLLFMACLSVSGVLWAVSPVPAPDNSDFSPAQQAEIEHIVENYLIAHPEILTKMDRPRVRQAICHPAR